MFVLIADVMTFHASYREIIAATCNQKEAEEAFIEYKKHFPSMGGPSSSNHRVEKAESAYQLVNGTNLPIEKIQDLLPHFGLSKVPVW